MIWHRARRWLLFLARAGTLLGAASAMARPRGPVELPHPLAGAAFGLTGAGR